MPMLRYDAFSHGGDPEPRIIARHTKVARERDLQAAADTVRLNRRDDDRIQRFQFGKPHLLVPEKCHAGIALRQGVEVDAAAEGAAGTPGLRRILCTRRRLMTHRDGQPGTALASAGGAPTASGASAPAGQAAYLRAQSRRAVAARPPRRAGRTKWRETARPQTRLVLKRC